VEAAAGNPGLPVLVVRQVWAAAVAGAAVVAGEPTPTEQPQTSLVLVCW